MKLMAWLWWTPVASAVAIPLAWRQAYERHVTDTEHRWLHARDDRTVFQNPETGEIMAAGETNSARTIYVVVSMFCAVVLALSLGLRAKILRNNVFKKSNFTSVLVLLMFFFGLGFIFAAVVVEAGQSLRTQLICYSAAIICLVFYTGNKLTIYVFLLERARIVRSPFCPRQKDWLWISGMIIIFAGFGTIAVVGYLSPIVELSPIDAKCRIGLPAKVSFPLLSFDVGVNFFLTTVFIWLLKPVLDYHGLLSMTNLFGSRLTCVLQREARRQRQEEDSDTQLCAMNKNIKTLLWKCLIGSTLVMFPTVANMAQFYIMKGREQAWICLTICTLDVSWGVVVVNWLTIGSAEAEKNLTSLMSQRTLASAERPLALTERTVSLTEVRSREPSIEGPPAVQVWGKAVREQKQGQQQNHQQQNQQQQQQKPIQQKPRELIDWEKQDEDDGPCLGPRRHF